MRIRIVLFSSAQPSNIRTVNNNVVESTTILLSQRRHWHFLWLLACGMTATVMAAVTVYSAYWIGRIAQRYNADGPDSMRDQRHTMCTAQPDLPAAYLTEVEATLAGPHPQRDRWRLMRADDRPVVRYAARARGRHDLAARLSRSRRTAPRRRGHRSSSQWSLQETRAVVAHRARPGSPRRLS
jgi:hypothetical protein